jgi:hypothetical protein
VGSTDLVTPETTPDGNDGQLGQDDGAADGGSDFLGALDTETDVAVGIADGNKSLEAGALTGTGLLLDGHDLQHLVLEGSAQVKVDDLELLKKEKKMDNKDHCSSPMHKNFIL